MHDLVVISDLHLGRGRNPRSGRYHLLEAFFYDEELYRFCEYLCQDSERRDVPFRLVLNGDVFDFLRADDDEDVPPFQPPHIAAPLVTAILRGHTRFVDALALVIARGHSVVCLPGNHDVETQWNAVRVAMRDAVRERLLEKEHTDAAARVDEAFTFRSWFYYEPGRIWIEHGSQYDHENSFRCFLRGDIENSPEAVSAAGDDVPLGSFFQRYLYNNFGHITFIVPSSRAHLRYFKWLFLNQPRFLVRVLLGHGPFLLQVLRRVARIPGDERRTLEQAHARQLDELAKESGLGEKLHAIDALKNTRDDVSNTVHELGRQALRLVIAAAVAGAITVGLWFAGFHTINQLQSGFGIKAFLFLLLNFIFLAAALGGVVYAFLRAPAAVTGSPKPLRTAANAISGLLEVPIVTFGHTHDEVLWRLGGENPGRWYYNSGTWIAVFTHDVLLPRERVQFTFLRVREAQAELLAWNPARGEPTSVVLLDEEPEDDQETTRPATQNT